MVVPRSIINCLCRRRKKAVEIGAVIQLINVRTSFETRTLRLSSLGEED